MSRERNAMSTVTRTSKEPVTSPVQALKGLLRKPAGPVSIEDMKNAPIDAQCKQSDDCASARPLISSVNHEH